MATHALIGGLLVVALVLSTAYWVYLVRPGEGRRTALWIGLACTGAASVAVLISSVWVPEGVVPTLNPESTGRLETLFKTVREAPVPWAIVTVGAIAVLFRRRWTPAVAATIATGLAWAIAGLAFYLLTAEPRGLMVVQVGVVVTAFAAFAGVLNALKGPQRSDPPSNARALGYRLLVIAGISVFCSLVVSGVCELPGEH